MVEGGLFKLGGASIVDPGHDDEDAIGAGRARLRHLVGVVHEILTQHRERCRPARRAQMIEAALERRRIGQNRKASRAAGLVGTRKRRRIELLADQPL